MATERRLIDANALRQEIESKIYWGQSNNVAYLEAIDDAPTVDAVEVVRCEKCRYYEKAEYDDGYKMVCRLLKRQTAYNGFCYCGERRIDNA